MISLSANLADQYLSSFRNRKAVQIACKSLVAYVIIKMVLVWPLSGMITDIYYIPPPVNLIPRLLFWPSVFAMTHHDVFYVCSLAVLALSLFLPWNYMSGALFFWICLNLLRLHSSIINGSDLVVTMLAFWSIGMSVVPVFRSAKLRILQVAVFSLSVLFCQVQVAGIYLVSGWDKLWNTTWQSGEAFAYIAHFDSLINPWFVGSLSHKGIQFFLSWLTIVFELVFVVLIWFRKTRIPVLLVGVVFHLVIMIMLTLPEFGILMILSYLVFLEDSDYDRIRNVFKRPQL
ncbi:MAG TPA: HTTM domain-containing protein [Ohtaekwangia sp.]